MRILLNIKTWFTEGNVANADTDGYKKIRVILKEQLPQGVAHG